jgi:hypothetical protein
MRFHQRNETNDQAEPAQDPSLKPRPSSNIILRIRDEIRYAKSSAVLDTSIGDQIIALLRQTVAESDDATERASAQQAVDILENFRTTQGGPGSSKEEKKKVRGEILEKLHHVDINLHVLALDWLRQYVSKWWAYIRERRKAIKAAKRR